MKKRRSITAIFAALGMLILILDGKAAVAAASEGVELCLRTLVPSLFPFFVLSALLTGSLAGQPLRILTPVGKLCGIPEGAESLLAVGLLGGYPVGAQNIGQAYSLGGLSKQDAQRMLAFCNNAGPAFLFGVIAPFFSEGYAAWFLFGIHSFSAILVGILTAKGNRGTLSGSETAEVTLPQALEQAVKAMVLVCGWVVMFRMLLAFLQRWIFWYFPEPVQVLLAGILELSNGCVQLGRVESEGLRFIIASVLLSLGGVCVAMQTATVTPGLSLRYYFPGKLLQCGISALLAILAQGLLPAAMRYEVPIQVIIPVALGTVFFAAMAHRGKKSSSIPSPVGV